MISKHILWITFLNEPELILFFHTDKWFHLFLFNMNNFIYYYSFVCAQFNSFKYYYVSLTIIHLSFVYTQLND